MCLGIPGRVVEITGTDVTRMGKLEFGGIVKDVSLAYVPEIEVGDYAIVHVGFAITRLDEASARETLALLREMDSVERELDPAVALEAEEAAAIGSDEP